MAIGDARRRTGFSEVCGLPPENVYIQLHFSKVLWKDPFIEFFNPPIFQKIFLENFLMLQYG